MKHLFIAVLCPIFSINSIAHALEYGECKARTDSKRYVDADFQAPYPKNVVFTCLYDCFGDSGVETIQGTSSIRVADTRDDGLKVVCQGVKVRYTGVYYQYVGTNSFYAYDARPSELKAWAFQNVDKNNPREREKLEELKKLLLEVGTSYQQVGQQPSFTYFREASAVLLAIAQGLPEDTAQLDATINDYVLSASDAQPTASAAKLIQGILKSSASFRIP